MKKLIPLLLAAALCLCAGCGEATPATTPTPIPTPEATPTPTPTPVPTPEPEIIYEVQTDYSQYTSYEKETVEPIYTRLSEDWINDLAPRSDYGMLYPFVGTEMHNQYGSSGYLYGLYDQHGRIVADPSYTVVEAMDNYYGEDNEWIYAPMLRLGRSDGEDMVYAAASFDGSFVTECRYRAVKALSCGVLCVDDLDYENFTAYDLEGNVLFTRDELKFDGISSIFGGEDGIYTVKLGTVSASSSVSYYYMNSDLELFAGPYNTASSFRHGLAIVQEGAGWGVIGADGEWLIEPDYNGISRGHDGQFLAKKGGKYVVYDSDGNEIFTVNERFLHIAEYGYYGDSGSRWLKNGMPIVIEGEGWQDTEGHLPVVYRSLPDGGTELLNVLSGKKMVLEGDCLVRPLYVDFMNVIIGSAAYLHVIDFSTPDSQMLISWNLKKTIPAGTSMGIVSVATDPVTGMEYTQLDGAFYTLGSELALAFDYDDILPRIWNGRFIVTDDVSSTCYDTSGNVLFRYPLVLPGED